MSAHDLVMVGEVEETGRLEEILSRMNNHIKVDVFTESLVCKFAVNILSKNMCFGCKAWVCHIIYGGAGDAGDADILILFI